MNKNSIHRSVKLKI